MKCEMCGYRFQEKEKCNACGKQGCGEVKCPFCGYAKQPPSRIATFLGKIRGEK